MMYHPKRVKKVHKSATDLWDQAERENQPMRGQMSLDDVQSQDCEEGSGISSRSMDQTDPENQPMRGQSFLDDVTPQESEEGSQVSNRPMRSSRTRKSTNERAEFPRWCTTPRLWRRFSRPMRSSRPRKSTNERTEFPRWCHTPGEWRRFTSQQQTYEIKQNQKINQWEGRVP